MKIALIVGSIIVVLVIIGTIVGGGDDDKKKQTSSAETQTTPNTPLQPRIKSMDVAITSPSPGDVIKKSSVVVKGTAEPGAAIKVAGQSDRANSDGRWAIRLPLDMGHNDINVEATLKGYEDAEDGLSVTRRRSAAEIREMRRRAAAKRAAAEADFKASAQTIPYNQLAKNPDKYAGEHVVYRGQIFQIQESGGAGFMLLSVTDDGYGFWDDNVWVNYNGSIESAEDDIVTIYGTVLGQKSYETQIGGETFVPEIDAEYIDE
jgi:hypothetical protein